MNTVECKLEDLFGDPCQYVVPSFQRPFSWSDDRHEVFLSGVLDSFSSDSPHRIFLGAIVIMTVLGPGLQNVFIAIGVLGWATIARIFRGSILSVKENEYVEAARALGPQTSMGFFAPRLLMRLPISPRTPSPWESA